MMKINTKSTRTKDGWGVDCELHLEGNGGALACELATVLNDLEEKAPEIVMQALEMYLSQRGF